MDDNFLYQNRPSVRPGFGETLYSRISSLPLQKGKSGNALRFTLRFAVVSVILFTVVFSSSQPVRASILDWIKQIAGFDVQETNTVSVEDSITMRPDVSGPLDDILNDLPYKIAMPSYVPDGFNFEDRVNVHAESVFMTWRNSAGDQILMQVDTDHGQRYLMGIDAAQEILINGQPALLAQGGYDADNIWNPDLKMMNIIQRRGDLIYWLIYVHKTGGGFDSGTVEYELTHMMELIP